MPQSSSKARPPEPMTRGRAALLFALSILFDAVRAFFQFFWFFAPALAALYCTTKVGSILSTWTFGLLSTKTAGALCTSASALAGTALVEFTAPFGVIMADAIGLAGFFTLGLIVIMTNMRILKAASNAPWYFAGAFAAAEVPFLGALPLFTIILWRLYGAQNKAETAALQAWEKTHAAELQGERQRQAAEILRLQQAQAAQIAEQEAANDELFIQKEQEVEERQTVEEQGGREFANEKMYMVRDAANDESSRLQANG